MYRLCRMGSSSWWFRAWRDPDCPPWCRRTRAWFFSFFWLISYVRTYVKARNCDFELFVDVFDVSRVLFRDLRNLHIGPVPHCIGINENQNQNQNQPMATRNQIANNVKRKRSSVINSTPCAQRIVVVWDTLIHVHNLYTFLHKMRSALTRGSPGPPIPRGWPAQPRGTPRGAARRCRRAWSWRGGWPGRGAAAHGASG